MPIIIATGPIARSLLTLQLALLGLAAPYFALMIALRANVDDVAFNLPQLLVLGTCVVALAMVLRRLVFPSPLRMKRHKFIVAICLALPTFVVAVLAGMALGFDVDDVPQWLSVVFISAVSIAIEYILHCIARLAERHDFNEQCRS